MRRKGLVWIGFVCGLVIGVVIGLVLWHDYSGKVSASTSNVVVLCSSCLVPGMPGGGSLILLDQSTGDVWVYSDAAMEGTANPVRWGRLSLGKPVVRVPIMSR
jgi:hypothetical protein